MQRPPSRRWSSGRRSHTEPAAVNTTAARRRFPRRCIGRARIRWWRATRRWPFSARSRTQRHRWPAPYPGVTDGDGPRCPTGFGAADSPGRSARTPSPCTPCPPPTAPTWSTPPAAGQCTTRTSEASTFTPRASMTSAARTSTMPWTAVISYSKLPSAQPTGTQDPFVLGRRFWLRLEGAQQLVVAWVVYNIRCC